VRPPRGGGCPMAKARLRGRALSSPRARRPLRSEIQRHVPPLSGARGSGNSHGTGAPNHRRRLNLSWNGAEMGVQEADVRIAPPRPLTEARKREPSGTIRGPREFRAYPKGYPHVDWGSPYWRGSGGSTRGGSAMTRGSADGAIGLGRGARSGKGRSGSAVGHPGVPSDTRAWAAGEQAPARRQG